MAHELIPEIAVAAIVIAATVRYKNGASLNEASRWAGDEAVAAGLSNFAGVAAMWVTGTAWARLPASLGMRFAIATGKVAMTVAEQAREMRTRLELVSESLHQLWLAQEPTETE